MAHKELALLSRVASLYMQEFEEITKSKYLLDNSNMDVRERNIKARALNIRIDGLDRLRGILTLNKDVDVIDADINYTFSQVEKEEIYSILSKLTELSIDKLTILGTPNANSAHRKGV